MLRKAAGAISSAQYPNQLPQPSLHARAFLARRHRGHHDHIPRSPSLSLNGEDMSLVKHSLGDRRWRSLGSLIPSPVPVLRPLLDRQRAHWSLTPSGCLPLIELKWSLTATCVGTTNSYPYRLLSNPPGRIHAREVPLATVGLPKPCRPHRARLL